METVLYVRILFQGLLSTDLHPEASFSAGHCVNTCYYNRTCASVFYDRSLQLCYQSNTWFDAQVAGLTTKPEVSYLIFHRADCPAGWVYHKPTNKCFYFHNTLKKNSELKQVCMTAGGRVYNIYTAEENDIAYTVVKRRGKDVWIGLNFNTDWNWHKGTAPPDFFYWSEPPGTFSCVTFSDATKKWLRVKCGDLYTGLCEITVPNNCSLSP
ncbi:type-2 ice-structuring protein-like [Haliotis cracherodii]|uniref:type-2 ice-structuring protein-like n=1 Tax=Haliotis cracherodii TaxID=6455 RepID=UPI0039EB044B